MYIQKPKRDDTVSKNMERLVPRTLGQADNLKQKELSKGNESFNTWIIRIRNNIRFGSLLKVTRV